MTEKRNQYFIAIIPPKKVCDTIIAFKNDLADRFESKAALKIVPHITLKAPFHFPAASHDLILQWFKEMHVTQTAFPQQLKNFGAFHKRRPVIFIKPVMNPELRHLQKLVIENFIGAYGAETVKKTELKFHPHVTVAYRDLQKNKFREAWKEYEEKKFSARFTVNSFSLLQHDGKRWNIIYTFLLPSSI